jgi:hypothetical protein
MTTTSIKIVDLSKIYSKKDIKREMKAAGFGRVDSIKFEEVSYNSSTTHSAYVWFRPTKKSFVLAKRDELTKKFSETTYRMTSIRVRCAETPRTQYNEDWCLTENNSMQADEVGHYHNKELSADLVTTVKRLEDKLERHATILHQLIGGLFHQSIQKGMLDSYMSILFGHPNIPPSVEEYEWPTTRQGDLLKEQLESLEQQFDVFSDEVVTNECLMHGLNLKLALLEDKVNCLARNSMTSVGLATTSELDNSDEEEVSSVDR